MSYELKVTEDQASFIEGYTMITDFKREVYYVPYWFEKTGDKVYAVHGLDKLPDSIKALIMAHRGVDTSAPKNAEVLYGAEDMIAFAKRFLKKCNKGMVTERELAIFNEEGRHGTNNDSV